MTKLLLLLLAPALALALVAKPTTPILGFSTWNCMTGDFTEVARSCCEDADALCGTD